MVDRVQNLALGYPEGRIEVQLIGGYKDQQSYAEDLFFNIMRKYIQIRLLFRKSFNYANINLYKMAKKKPLATMTRVVEKSSKVDHSKSMKI